MTTDMHAERVATALERIADALERPRTDRLPGLLDIAQRGLDRVAASFRLDRSPDDSRLAMQDLVMELRAALDAKPCDDRTCTDRDHWAPPKFNPGGRVGGDYVIPKVPLRGYERSFSVEEIRAFLSDKPVVVHGRISHGPEQCIHGQDRNDALECATPCAATMPGHQCTRSEHADDRHAWAMSDEEAQRILRTGQDMGFVAEADPLDEDDHRPRHFPDGAHLRRYACGHWHLATRDRCNDPHQGDSHTLAWWADSESLTFCDCDDATIEVENGATD